MGRVCSPMAEVDGFGRSVVATVVGVPARPPPAVPGLLGELVVAGQAILVYRCEMLDLIRGLPEPA